jgi:hypothetical protein
MANACYKCPRRCSGHSLSSYTRKVARDRFSLQRIEFSFGSWVENGGSTPSSRRLGNRDDFSLAQKGCKEIGMDCSRLVFYHADLSPKNIIVKA